jgi:hypothetical protein
MVMVFGQTCATGSHARAHTDTTHICTYTHTRNLSPTWYLHACAHCRVRSGSGGADNSSKMKKNDAIYACAHIAPRRIYSY